MAKLLLSLPYSLYMITTILQYGLSVSLFLVLLFWKLYPKMYFRKISNLTLRTSTDGKSVTCHGKQDSCLIVLAITDFCPAQWNTGRFSDSLLCQSRSSSCVPEIKCAYWLRAQRLYDHLFFISICSSEFFHPNMVTWLHCKQMEFSVYSVSLRIASHHFFIEILRVCWYHFSSNETWIWFFRGQIKEMSTDWKHDFRGLKISWEKLAFFEITRSVVQ